MVCFSYAQTDTLDAFKQRCDKVETLMGPDSFGIVNLVVAALYGSGEGHV